MLFQLLCHYFIWDGGTVTVNWDSNLQCSLNRYQLGMRAVLVLDTRQLRPVM